MTPQEHYAEAERVRHVALYLERRGSQGFTGWPRAELLAYAQLHATLALAAPSSLDAAESGAEQDG